MPKKLLKKIKAKVKAETAAEEKYILRLFVTGTLPNSARAIANSMAFCEKYLKDRYELEIIDIYQQPSLALKEEIVAIPLLIKKFPLPEERLTGDLSNIEKALKGLQLI